MVEIILFFLFNLFAKNSFFNETINTLFPVENYNQTIHAWIKATDDDYNKPLLTQKQQQYKLKDFYKHYIFRLSPWDDIYVKSFLNPLLPNKIV
ncbi:MAG: hypothetical protein LEGION0398_MBIBDBAK_01021 [Legionellaceae bacterium]